ncbi:MAG: hypothetical protein NVV73_04960 [Cellvibrionaceae bacterium]|nr:hypothetical protein [Cellvibrionaceae bacterium]
MKESVYQRCDNTSCGASETKQQKTTRTLQDNRESSIQLQQKRNIQHTTSRPLVQRTAKNVADDIKGSKYPNLSRWYGSLRAAVEGKGVTVALTRVVERIVEDVAPEDVSIQRGVYDDLRKLLGRYNTKNYAHSINLDTVPSLPAREIQATSEFLSYPDSPSHSGLTQEEASSGFFQIFNERPTITLQDQQGNNQSIPILDSFAKAGRAIRYQQYAKEKINPAPFSVQQGDIHTLFEYRQDYVANPLRQHEDAYRRDGQIGSWAALIRLIDVTTTIKNIIDIINNNVTTQPTQIQLEVAGAMVADVKNGIQNWITIMNNLPADTTIKKLLETEYKGFVDSRSYKTLAPRTGLETSLNTNPEEVKMDEESP